MARTRERRRRVRMRRGGIGGWNGIGGVAKKYLGDRGTLCLFFFLVLFFVDLVLD